MRPSDMPYMLLIALMRVPLWILLLPVATAQLPYNPTRILQHGSSLYVFQPSPGSATHFELGSLDISSSIVASKLPYTTLYPTLPFLGSHEQRAFTPLLSNGGNMTVYAGDCSAGASGGEIWSFNPDSSGTNGNGSWKLESVSFDALGDHVPEIGPNYLNGGVAFSALVDGGAADTGAYFFGGMCPYSNQTAGWQAAANYSNLMVTLEPSNSQVSLIYQLDTSSSRGPPIAEAGFTLTGLEPSFSNRSDGTQTQQQNFVLVGGHTSSAFINMSQVALFALPQQGWTFVPVLQPDVHRTDLAIRTDIDTIDPRSGHTAVLTPDGQRIIIFGGWVGDVGTPAEPQLAILNIGEGYGGKGPWQWTVPTTFGTGLSQTTGVYGHGAAMLPGGVMAIMGGYSISPTNAKKRRADQTANTAMLFFNVTSNTWLTEYLPPSLPSQPSPPSKPSSEPSNSGPLTTTSQKAGLGAGVGIGMATVLSLFVFYLWYTRRLKKQRLLREKQLNDLALAAHRYNLDDLSPGFDGRGSHTDAQNYFDDSNDSYAYPSVGARNTRDKRQSNGHDAERTGLLVEIPSPTRGLRKSLSARSNQHMSRYDERRVKGSGHIHPIDELEEEPEQEQLMQKTSSTVHPEMSERRPDQRASIFDSAPVLDPYVENRRTADYNANQHNSTVHSAPVSPVHQDDYVSQGDWQLAVGAVIPCHSSPKPTGRSSPNKSERTESNLSERSARTHFSSTSSGSIRRSASMRSAVVAHHANHANPFVTPDGSPTSAKARNADEGWEMPADQRTQSLTSIRNTRPNTASGDKESFATARTSFMQLQAEGEVLLGGAPDRARPGTSSTSNGSTGRPYQETELSMSRAGTVTAATSVTDGPLRTRRRSWLGSVRRALSRSTTADDVRTRSLTTSTPHLEKYTDNPLSPAVGAEKNRKSFPAASPPRRAASDASFWRSRRGQRDWLDEELDPNDPKAKWTRNSGDNWGAPEDVALAEEERQRREWRERGALLNFVDGDLPTPHTPIQPRELGDPNRPLTPADESDWDVEAAVERRVVQVMFTVPRSKLRVVNADVDRSSLLSLPRENSDGGSSTSGTPSRVRDLVDRFERDKSPRLSHTPSPSPSVTSLKVRGKGSVSSLPLTKQKRSSSLSKTGGGRLASEDITASER
jgi:hypothetical protein